MQLILQCIFSFTKCECLWGNRFVIKWYSHIYDELSKIIQLAIPINLFFKLELAQKLLKIAVIHEDLFQSLSTDRECHEVISHDYGGVIAWLLLHTVHISNN